ncbi:MULTISPECIES: hypothetical protein [Streptomyces]|uniref:Uncharacterized protein n=1 Tax=Streptomyces luteosporeus TaxID=173856 RepID=A0ABN3U0M2_9ACTN
MREQPVEPPAPFKPDILRDLAAVLGRTPEALAIEWAAGSLVIPTATIGETLGEDGWGLFDGPS